MKVTVILLLFLLPRDNSASHCVDVTEDHVTDYYSMDYSEEELFDSSTLTCTHLSTLDHLPIPPTYRPAPHKFPHYLNISQSTVSKVPSGAFASLSYISRLYMSGIGVNEIEAGAFRNLTQLKKLHLDNNYLVALKTGAFAELQSLELLDLSHNGLRTIRMDVFRELQNLVELNLSWNYLQPLPDRLFASLKSLQVLDLTSNPLTTVPKQAMVEEGGTLALTQLRSLKLGYNVLLEFDFDLANSSVSFLNLSSNYLTGFNFSLIPSNNMIVDLSHNAIEMFDNGMTSSQIFLDHNRIEVLNETSFQDCHLSLSHNKIKVLAGSSFSRSETMISIDLSHNYISTLQRGLFANLHHLKRLDLSSNNITAIEVGTFKDLAQLEVLNLSHNRLETLPVGVFEGLTHLGVLSLASNRLKSLEIHVFSPLVDLREFHIDGNQLSSLNIEAILMYTTELHTVTLSDNLWKCNTLMRIIHVLKLKDVKVEWGKVFQAENIHGIACLNAEEVEEPTTLSVAASLERSYRDFRKAVNVGVQGSKLGAFLNENFKSSKLFRFLNSSREGQQSSKAEVEDHNSLLMVANVVGVIVSVLLLMVICAIFVKLKNFGHSIRGKFSSHTELYYKA